MKRKIWHFSKRTTVWLYRFFEAIVALFLVLFSIAFWKLYTEPMDAKFMLPTLSEELLPEGSKYSLRVDSAILSAEFREDGLFHLEMKNLQLVRPDQTVAIDLPTVNLSYGFWHIITLNYMPDTLAITRPDIHLIVDKEGQWRFQETEKVNAPKTPSMTLANIKPFLLHMLAFEDIRISDGILTVKDLEKGENLSLPQFELQLHRRYGFRHVARLNAVAQISGYLTDIQSKMEYSRLTKNLTVEVGVSPVHVSRYGRFASILKGIDLPVSVSLAADFNMRSRYKDLLESLKKLKFQVKALKGGTVTLPSPIHGVYHVQSAEINGAASEGLKTVKIAESKVFLKGGIEANLIVEAKGLSDFIRKGNVSDIKTVLEATVMNVPMVDVPKVWPKEQGTAAHQWVENHLSKGKVSKADFKLVFQGSELEDVLGDIFVTGAYVDYLPDMPAIEDVEAEVILKPEEVRIIASKGHAGHVKLMNAALLFDLKKEITDLSIALELDGPISEMLYAIDKKPLRLLKGINFNWKQILGNAETRVTLLFPLDEENLVKDLKVDVQANSKNVGVLLPNIPLILENGKVNLSVNKENLILKGNIDFKEQPIEFEWQEYFRPLNGISSIYNVNGQIESAALGEIIPDIKEYIDGPFSFNTHIERHAADLLWQGTADFKLDDALVVLYPFSITKRVGEKTTLKLTSTGVKPSLDEGNVVFHLNGISENKEMVIQGETSWGKDWSISLDKVQAPMNTFQGVVRKENELFTLRLIGDSWNVSQLKTMPLFQKDVSGKTEKTVLPKDIVMEAKLKKLILNPAKPMEDIIVNAERKNKIWKYFQAEAKAKEPFVVVYDPEKHAFEGEFADLGALLSYAGVSDRFSGGKLRLDSKQNEMGLIKGKIKVVETELNETSFMLQAVSILGIVDAIRGKNIVFSEINIPFEFAPEGEFHLSDAYAANSNIGVTFKGIINLDALDIEGAVIPAYLVNSLPGKIPLIGALFREGEGGGLIGVKYSVKGRPTKPEVEFHPLSSMAPGALGYIF